MLAKINYLTNFLKSGTPTSVSDSDPLPVSDINVVPSPDMPNGNSFDGALAADEVKTGPWEDLGSVDASAVRVTIKSDQDSATAGFTLEWSHDGSFVLESEDNYFVAADAGKTFTFGRAARYVRVVYTNGSTPTTRTVIATSFFRGPVKWSSHKVNEGIDNETDAEMVKSVLTGEIKNGILSGKYRNATVDPTGRLNVNIKPHSDIFSNLVVASRDNQIQANFFETISTQVDISTTGSGTITPDAGQAVIATGTDNTASATAKTFNSVRYRAAHEIFAFFTSGFTTPTDGSSFQRIGIFDANNGFFIGYEGIQFGATFRQGGVDTFIPMVNFDGDPLDGSEGSLFTRNGIPEAIDFTKMNVFSIRFGWLGSAHIIFEVLSPDGDFVIFHTIRQPNLSQFTSVSNPELPIEATVSKNASDATDLIIRSGCWAGGSGSDKDRIDSQIRDDTLAQTTRTVLVGKVASGQQAGDYVNVTVTPQGRLAAEVTGQTIGDPVGTSGFLELHEDPSGNVQPAKQDASGNLLVKHSGDVDVLDTGEREYTPGLTGQVVTASGDTTIYQAGAGVNFRIRALDAIPVLRGSEDAPVITIKVLDDQSTVQKSFAVAAISKRKMIGGYLEGSVVVNLDIASRVPVTFDIEEL